jgi:hypothetical protein
MRAMTAVLLVNFLFAACSQANTANVQPVVLSRVYDLEVSTTGFQAFLIVHEPLRPNTKDSVWSKSDGWSECTPLNRRGRTRCDGFELRAANGAIIGTYEVCDTTGVPQTRTVTDLTTGETRQETVRVDRTHCSPVSVTVTARGLRKSE